MRKMTLALLLVLATACGDDDDTPPGGDAAEGDGGGGSDSGGGGGDSGAGGSDSGGGGSDGSSAGGGIGDLCATSAMPGQPGSCMDPLVCCLADTNICADPEECPGGGGFVSCTHSPDCPAGRICCMVEGMGNFCTKTNTCSMYGGVEVP